MSISQEYVILFHDCPHNQHLPKGPTSPAHLSMASGAERSGDRRCGSHWDLMLTPSQFRADDSHPLITFEIRSEPAKWRSGTLRVHRLPNHRIIYLEYQGEISGNRGTVDRIDKGSLEWVEATEERLVWISNSYACEPQSLFSQTRFIAERISESEWKLQIA